MSKNLSNLSSRQGLQNNLFDRYGQLKMEDGSPSKAELEKLSKEFLMGGSSTYGATTFYDFLKPDNKNKKVYICNGSACLCAGTQEALKKEISKIIAEDEIGHMCCLGRCHENGSFHYNGHNYSSKSPSEIKLILNGDLAAYKDDYSVKNIGPQVLTADFDGIDQFTKILSGQLKRNPVAVLDDIKASGIRGRGGAGFPMGIKLDFCRKAKGDTKFIICNADEGDPGAFSDRYLLEIQPYSVLFGMIISGFVTGAEWGVVYIRGEYPESVEIIENTVRQLESLNLCGENILGSGVHFHLKVIKAQGSYICGEETALINSIEGQRPEVRIRPPYPAQEGLFGKPTVVNNVETQAALYAILKNGAKWYSELGTPESTGTKLLSLDSFFNEPGLIEVEMGTPLKKVVYDLAGGFKQKIKALHIGGPLGGIVPVEKINDLTVDFESFSSNGFLLGHASILCIPESMPMIKYLEHLMEFAADESCGKCFPCRLGTKRAQEMMHKAIHEDYKIDKILIDDLLHALETGSLCAHGGGIPLPVRNSLHHFKDELSEFIN